MHGGSLNVNGNPSWGLSTTWKWKIGADLRAKFSSCSFKGCLLQDAQENIWWMPSAVFLHTAHSERTPFFHCLGPLSSCTPKESLVTTPACTVQHTVWPCTLAICSAAHSTGGTEGTGTALNVHYKQKKPNSQGISQAKSSLHFTTPYRLGCFEVLGVGQNFAPINVRSMRFTPHFSGTLIYIMASVFLKMPPISLDSLFFYLVITFQLRKTKLVEIQE